MVEVRQNLVHRISEVTRPLAGMNFPPNAKKGCPKSRTALFLFPTYAFFGQPLFVKNREGRSPICPGVTGRQVFFTGFAPVCQLHSLGAKILTDIHPRETP